MGVGCVCSERERERRGRLVMYLSESEKDARESTE